MSNRNILDMYKKIQENIWENGREDILIELAIKYNDSHILKNLDLTDENIKNKIFKKAEEYGKIYFLAEIDGVDWNDKKEEIWKSLKKEARRFKGIDWSDKKEEIWESVKYLGTQALHEFEGINWSDKKEEIWEKELASLDYDIPFFCIHQIEGIDWSDKKEKIWDIINDFIIQNENFYTKGIDWSDKKEEIWELATKNGRLDLLYRLEGIDWSDRKEELWEIATKNENLSLLYRFKGIDWRDKKEEIWGLATKNERFDLLYCFEGIDWSDKKEEIWGLVTKDERIDLLYRLKGIDWSDRKEELWKIAENEDRLGVLSEIEGIDWSDRKKEILELARRSQLKFLFRINGINWFSNNDNFQLLLRNLINFNNPDLYNKILEIQKQYNPVYIHDLQDFTHTKFPSFDDQMIVNSNDGKLTDNKEFTIQLIESFNNVGILDDLLHDENENIKVINEVLSVTGKKIPIINYEQLKGYIEKLNVQESKEALELLVIERHLLNKWAHNIESYVQADIMCNLSDEIIAKTHAKNLSIYGKIMDSINNGKISSAISGKNIDFDTIKKILENYGVACDDKMMGELKEKLSKFSGQNILQKRKSRLSAYIGDEFNCRRKNDPPPTAQSLCDKYFSDFKSLRENYYKAVKSCNGKNRVSTYSFSQIIERFLKNPATFQDNLEDLKFNDNKTNRGKSILIEIQKFFKKASMYLDSSTINELFTRSAEYLDLTADCYDTKQAITSTIITTVKELEMEEKNICCMRLSAGRKNEDEKDALDIFLDGHIQVYGGHFEENSDTSNNPHYNDIKYFEEPAEINMEEILKRSDPFIKTFVPIGRVSDEIRDGFRVLEETIRHIEQSDVEEGKVGEQLLREIKGNNPDKYEALKIKILLGAGLDRFMAYYNENTKVTEQTLISGIATNNSFTKPEKSSEQPDNTNNDDLNIAISLLIKQLGQDALKLLENNGISQGAMEYAKKLIKDKRRKSSSNDYYN